MASYLLDSTVLIDFLRGRAHVVRGIRALDSEGHLLAICAVNVTEVFSGMLDHERDVTEELLSTLLLWDISYADARAAGELRGRLRRRGKAISVPDAMVAAVAIANNATLLTANLKDFDVPELKVEALRSVR